MSNTNKKQMKNYIWFLLGMAGVLLQMLPYVILGENTVIPYHDQLDGEMIAYIMRAKYLFGENFMPEFMGGMVKTALTLPAPGFLLFFLIGEPFPAYVLMHLTVIVVAYVGMYLLAKESGCKEFFAVLLGGVFAYLPFLPVYGLSEFGIPLLVWFWLRAGKGKNVKGCLIYGGVYALCSSLVLVGFAVLGMIGVEWLISTVMWIRKKSGEYKIQSLTRLGLLVVMTVVYVVENASLIGQILGFGSLGDVVSHKEEYVVEGMPFLSSLWNAFANHTQHSHDNHMYLLAAMLMAVVIGGVVARKRVACGNDHAIQVALRILGWIIIFAFIGGLWDSYAGVTLRENIGVLGSMSLSRVLWVSPTLWYWLMAIVIGVLCKVREILKQETEANGGWKVKIFTALIGVQVLTLMFVGALLLKNGTYPANVCRIIGREYSSISFSEYYANGVMEQVEDYIKETTGMEQEEYRVLSLGIDPAAAYYHGFYCLDGYSNNYSLEYKHKFREIIAPELAKSEYLTKYFDDWGNRCYLGYALIPGYYNFEKYTSYFWCFEMNVEAAKKMGAKYLLSAVYLTNAEEIGLKLLREEAFETEDSYYAIFLYELE